jgi:hypothetical protein
VGGPVDRGAGTETGAVQNVDGRVEGSPNVRDMALEGRRDRLGLVRWAGLSLTLPSPPQKKRATDVCPLSPQTCSHDAPS